MTALTHLTCQHIARFGAINLADFMTRALLHPEHGYYTTRTVFGAEGDFTTAPEISQIFGEVIAAYAAHLLAPHHEYNPALVELGAGRGTMMRDMLRVMVGMRETHQPHEVVILEASEKLKEAQQQLLSGFPYPMQWYRSIGELPKRACVMIANEFFDALPIRQAVYTEAGWRERMVDVSEGRLVFTLADTPHIFSHPTRPANIAPDIGTVFEWSDAARATMQQLSEHLKTYGGALVVVDYGSVQHGYGDTLQAVRQHHYSGVLEAVGTADITSHVNFAMLRDVAENIGLDIEMLTTQGQFLRQFGAEMRAMQLCKHATAETRENILLGLERLMSPAGMGSLFKVLVVTSQHAIGTRKA